jgi:hypothetical protein
MAMNNDPIVISSRAKPVSVDALAALVGALHRELRVFIAGFAPSAAFLDAAELAVWQEIRQRLADCPADGTAAAWARHLATGILQRLLLREDLRAVAAKDAIGHALAQGALQALQSEGVDGTAARRVADRFALLDEDMRGLLARRAAGVDAATLAQGLRGGEDGIAVALCAARAGLSGGGMPAPCEPRLAPVIERHLDGALSPEDHVGLDAELTRSLQLAAVLALQVRAHSILRAQLHPGGEATARALLARLAAQPAGARSHESSVVAAIGTHHPPRHRTPSHGAHPATRSPAGGSGGAMVAVGIAGALLLAAAGALFLTSGNRAAGIRPAAPAPLAGMGAPPAVVPAATPAPIVSAPAVARAEPPAPAPAPAALSTSTSMSTGAAKPVSAQPELQPLVLEEFPSPGAKISGHGDHVDAILALVPAPPGGGHGTALRIAWPAVHGKWVEATYEKTIPTPSITATSASAVRLALWAEADCGAKTIGLRFLDVKNEYWQWRSRIDPGSAGWREVKIPLVMDGSARHWGVDGNGKIDWPIRLKGYSVDFENDKVPAGAVLIDDLTLTNAAR